jgi:hypothetical protein
MIGFGKHIGTNFFDQNRAYIALGYVIPSIGKLGNRILRTNFV